MNPFKRVYLKALDMIFPSTGGGNVFWGWNDLRFGTSMPSSNFDYSRAIGDGRQSSIIVACVKWMQRTFPEAPLILEKTTDGETQRVTNHPFLILLDSPNPFYDSLLLQSSTIADLMLTGNAYWLKIRSEAGRVVQLWWAPSSMIEPKWPTDGSQYISHYEYKPGGKVLNIPPEDVVHFRDGLDPQNTRKGISPLRSLFREVFTDDEAANMTAALLKNTGVPGIVIAPDAKGGVSVSAEDARETKKWFMQNTTGDKRGEPLIMSGPTKVSQYGFSPDQMKMRDLRKIPEERISAVLGIPAIVAGLGAGLDRSTFANYKEAREAAYESTVIPTQRLTGAVMKRQLLVDFEDDVMPWTVGYDLSDVRILQEDENEKVKRVNNMVMGGYVKVVDAQRMTDTPVDETQDFYLRPINLLQVPSGSTGQKWLKEAKDAFWQKFVNTTESQEVMFRTKLKALFDEQEALVIKNLRKFKNIDDALFNESQANELFNDGFKPLIEKVFTDAYLDALGFIDPENPHKSLKQEFINTASVDWILNRSLELAQLVNGTTLKELRLALAEGFEQGESIPQLTKRIKSFYRDGFERRAAIVARTEVIAASSEGALVGYGEQGLVKAEFFPAPDACPECVALIGEYELKDTTGIIPVHPQCRCVWLPVVD